MMSTGLPSAMNGMSSTGRILEITPLLPCRPGQLVADADLALLGHVDPHQLVDTRRELVLVVAAEHLDVDHLAGLAVGNLERRVADLAGLLTEDGPEQPFLGGQLGLTLGCDLADEARRPGRPRRRCG